MTENALWWYRDLTKRLIRLREGDAWTDEAEDKILDEMDDAWIAMTPEQRSKAEADPPVGGA